MVGFSIGPKIDLDGNNSCRIISWPDGSCRPAHETEIALWAENEALRAEVERLTRERDCDPDGCKAHIDAFMHRAEAAESELARMKDRVARLEAVLRRAHVVVSDRAAGGRMLTPRPHASALWHEIDAALSGTAQEPHP